MRQSEPPAPALSLGTGGDLVGAADALLRSLHLDSAMGIGAWSPSTHRVRLSRSAAALLGTAGPRDIDLADWLGRLAPDSRGSLAAALARLLRAGEALDVEVETLPVAGASRWLRIAGGGLEPDASPVREIGFVVVDVTARWREEQRLADVERRWKFAMDASRQGLWDWDVAAGVETQSRELRQILGYDDDHSVRESIAVGLSVVHPEDVAVVRCEVERHLGGETPYFMAEFRALRRDGTYVWVESRGMVCTRDPDGRPLRMVGTLSDVSAQRSAREEIRATLEGLGTAYVACDADLRLVYVNGAAEALFGVHRGEMLGRNCRAVFPHEDAVRLAARLRSAAGGERREFEARIAGGQRWVRCVCQPRHGGGVTLCATDVTEDRRRATALEDARRQLEERAWQVARAAGPAPVRA